MLFKNKMRLSEAAKTLLDEKKLDELRALSFDELIHPNNQSELNQFLENSQDYSRRANTLNMGFADPVLLDGLKSAAVISSGFILSKAEVRKRFINDR
jgi:hypothetical protein